MVESLVNCIIGAFDGVMNIPAGKELITFIISCIPILELRGGLLAASLMNVQPVIACIVSIIGNLLPIPFILMFLTPIFKWMKKTKMFKKIVDKLESKALKSKEKVEKFEFWGLVLFVGIPLPGTGAWTGALVASVLEMNKKKAFLAICLGVILAAAIMMIISYGLLGNIIR